LYLLTIENKARYNLRLYLKAIARPVLALLNPNINIRSKRRNLDKILIKDILKRGNRLRGGIPLLRGYFKAKARTIDVGGRIAARYKR